MAHCETDRQHFYWYEDCLSLVTILAGCLGRKDLIRHGTKAGLWPQGAPQNPARLLLDVHEACHSDLNLRKAVSKQISRKYPGLIRKVRAADLERLADLDRDTDWPVHLLWACLTDPREEIRGYGRMLSHDLLWTAVRESFVHGRDQVDHQELEDLRSNLNSQVPENMSLVKELERTKAELKGLRRKLGRTPKNKAQPRPLPEVGQQREIRKLRYALEKAEAELARLKAAGEARACSCAEEGGPRSCRDESNGEDCGCCQESGDCRECPLEGRRVAVIGGLDRMEGTYRQVVERLGGEFEFHCGRVKAGCQKVQGIVNRSDYVVFITSINSHAALRVTKTFCKKKCKKFIALKQRGVESLERTLREASLG